MVVAVLFPGRANLFVRQTTCVHCVILPFHVSRFIPHIPAACRVSEKQGGALDMKANRAFLFSSDKRVSIHTNPKEYYKYGQIVKIS